MFPPSRTARFSTSLMLLHCQKLRMATGHIFSLTFCRGTEHTKLGRFSVLSFVLLPAAFLSNKARVLVVINNHILCVSREWASVRGKWKRQRENGRKVTVNASGAEERLTVSCESGSKCRVKITLCPLINAAAAMLQMWCVDSQLLLKVFALKPWYI